MKSWFSSSALPDCLLLRHGIMPILLLQDRCRRWMWKILADKIFHLLLSVTMENQSSSISGQHGVSLVLEELNAINEVYADWQKETGVKVITISLDDARTMNRVAPFINGRGWKYENYIDPNGDFKRAMNVNMPPHTFLLNGKVKSYEITCRLCRRKWRWTLRTNQKVAAQGKIILAYEHYA